MTSETLKASIQKAYYQAQFLNISLNGLKVQVLPFSRRCTRSLMLLTGVSLNLSNTAFYTRFCVVFACLIYWAHVRICVVVFQYPSLS